MAIPRLSTMLECLKSSTCTTTVSTTSAAKSKKSQLLSKSSPRTTTATLSQTSGQRKNSRARERSSERWYRTINSFYRSRRRLIIRLPPWLLIRASMSLVAHPVTTRDWKQCHHLILHSILFRMIWHLQCPHPSSSPSRSEKSQKSASKLPQSSRSAGTSTTASLQNLSANSKDNSSRNSSNGLSQECRRRKVTLTNFHKLSGSAQLKWRLK